MRYTLFFLLLILEQRTVAAQPLPRNAPYPHTEISNGTLSATIYLPDSAKGFYTGSRFDWAGAIGSLTYRGHRYFSRWSEEYDKQYHNAMTGPAQVFLPVGYTEAQAGERFINIGVGALVKPDGGEYIRYSSAYRLANTGTWRIKQGAGSIQFFQLLREGGYAYEYTKTLKLDKEKPELVITHLLKNTGLKNLETEAFNHNFFVIDSMPVGPGYELRFPVSITLSPSSADAPEQVSETRLLFKRRLNKEESIKREIGFDKQQRLYKFRVENRRAGAGVEVTGSQPLLHMAFWACATTVCPEPYIRIAVAPGEAISWTITYRFYTLPE